MILHTGTYHKKRKMQLLEMIAHGVLTLPISLVSGHTTTWWDTKWTVRNINRCNKKKKAKAQREEEIEMMAEVVKTLPQCLHSKISAPITSSVSQIAAWNQERRVEKEKEEEEEMMTMMMIIVETFREEAKVAEMAEMAEMAKMAEMAEMEEALAEKVV